MNRFSDIDYSLKKLPPVYGFRTEKLVSLEKALQPVESQIEELPYFIKLAKKHCNFPNKHGLSKDQSAAIYIYTMEWSGDTLYRVLNRALRLENRSALKIWFPYLKLFDTALDLLPTVKEVVWRGVPLDIGKNYTKNQIFTWWPVSSCSSSVDVIEEFLNDQTSSTLFLIEAINGKQVSGYTEFEKEDEIILKIGTEFRVKANPLKRSDGSHTVHLVEIKDEEEEEEEEEEKEEDVAPLTTTTQTLSIAPQPPLNDQVSNVNANASYYCKLKTNLKWKQDATTIAGGNGLGKELNQLNCPQGIYIDDDQQFIYIADTANHRIIRRKFGTDNDQIVAGGNGRGNQTNQLDRPSDMIVDRKTKSLIICDQGNERIVRWSLENQFDRKIVISNIYCYGLTMNHNGDLFVSDYVKHQVKKWRDGEKEGTVVAGGNGRGDRLNQLNTPRFIYVDENETVYVSDANNHRVMKWEKHAKEGVVVAGGYGQGQSLKQLNKPYGVIVNEVGDVHVADYENHRVMCWPSQSKEGCVVVGGHGKRYGSNQFNGPTGLAVDRENNLYVADYCNCRIQRFDIDEHCT